MTDSTKPSSYEVNTPRKLVRQEELRAALEDVASAEVGMMATILPELTDLGETLAPEVIGASDEVLLDEDGVARSATLVPEEALGTQETMLADESEETRAPMHTGRYRSLPLLELERKEAGYAPHFVVGEVLGRGGTGVVRKARQTALGREVAIKSLRRQLSTDLDAYLLREARLTGMLEHPNIIPVYVLGVDRDGQLLLVMKKIEGVAWSVLLREPDHPMWAELGDDQERWHLETLMQICHAVHYAHAQGVIHRDLKPDNVMIGAFGQVYLLDWGVALDERDRDVMFGVVGTPAYMAPEMANPDPSRISPRTDVYLLGAILYEMLAGRPPQLHATLPELFKGLSEGLEPPDLPEGAPDELVQIVRRAMNPDMEARYSSAQAIRLALDGYFRHRAAFALLQDGQARLDDVRALLSGLGDQEPTTPDVVAIHRTFAEGRFAFQEALTTLPDDRTTEATQGLQTLTETMIRFELVCANPISAVALLEDLPNPNSDLEDEIAQVQEAIAAREKELERLQEREHERDVNVGRVPRGVFVFGLGLFMSLLPMTVSGLIRMGLARTPTPRMMFYGSVVGVTLMSLGVWRWRATLMPNAASRALVTSIVATLVAIVFHRLLWALMAESSLRLTYPQLVEVVMVDMCIVAFGLTVLGLAVDRRLLKATPIYGVGLVLVAGGGLEYGMELLGLVNLIALTVIGVLWARPERA